MKRVRSLMNPGSSSVDHTTCDSGIDGPTG